MKNSIITALSFLLFITGYSQNSRYQYEYTGRRTPSVKEGKLKEVKSVNDLSPLLWSSLELPYSERYLLEQRRVNEYPQPQGYVYPQEKYKQVIEIVAVEISAVCNGKTLTAQSANHELTTEQKNILNATGLGADISIKIKYRYKDQADDSYGSRDKIIEGTAAVTVVPETEAEYPGGFKQITEYFNDHVINKVPDADASGKIQRAIVKFTVSEEGKIVDAKIVRTSTDPQLDKLLLEATGKMPKWKPAENSKGIKVRQEFIIPFGFEGC